MSSIFRSACVCTAILAVWGTGHQAVAQVQYVFQPDEGVHDWNLNENWLGDGTFEFVPDIDQAAGDTALVGTEATAQISNPAPRIGELIIDNSTVVIDDADQAGMPGSLETAVSAGSTGAVVVARPASRMEIHDSGALTVETVLSSVGQFHVYGPDATIDVDGDLLMSAGVLGAHITGPSHSAIMAGGSADLSGVLEVEISGATPSLGSSWDLVTAGGGIERMFEDVVVQNAPALDRGLQYRAVQAGNTASLEVGNSLIVTVDRQTGDTTIENAVGSGLTLASYALQSPAGTLSPGGAQSLNDSGVAGTGWLTSPSTEQLVAEVKPDSTFTLDAGESVSLGSALAPGVTPANEDIQFDFTTTDGQVLEGIVEYTGNLNDFVLYVDPDDGAVSMGNLSSFITPPDMTGYAIQSPSEQLLPGDWMSLESSGEAGPGWDAAPETAGALAETNLEDSHVFGFGSLIDLGQIFTAEGTQDLQFSYTVAGETSERIGSVVYGDIPETPGPVLGDYNLDGVVNAADYVVWRNTLGSTTDLTANGDDTGASQGVIDQADYVVWKNNFGNTVGSGAAGLAGQAIPEPGGLVLVCVGIMSIAAGRRREFDARK